MWLFFLYMKWRTPVFSHILIILLPFIFWASLGAQMVKNLHTMKETWVWFLGQEDPLEEKMATHSSILAWRAPWTEEPGRLYSKGSQGVVHDWAINTILHYYMKKAIATHSSTLAWKIPWTEESGRLQSMGSLRVGHDWATSLSLFPFMHCRRKWQPTPVFFPGESQGWGSLMDCCLRGRTELDTTEAT